MENDDNDDNNRRAIVIVAARSSFLLPFMSSSVNIALPSIGKEFMMDAVSLSWVATAYILAVAVFLVPLGRLADIHGRKKIFTIGVLIFTASSLSSGISAHATILISSRVLQGIGEAMMFVTAMALLTSAFPPGELGRALGINVASVYTGLSVGPFIGGWLTQNFGWRSVFLTSVPLGILTFLVMFRKLADDRPSGVREKFDIVGAAIYAFALVSVMYGVSLLPATEGLWLTLAGLAGVVAFVRWESAAGCPCIDIALFKSNATFAFSNLAALISYSATFAITFLLSLYLQYTKGMSPQSAGLILLSQPVTMAFFSPFAGKLSDRVEPRIVASVGMAITMAGLFSFTFLNEGTTLGAIVANLVLLGFGFALFSSPNTNAVMSCVEKRRYGVASATLGTMRLLGQMLSMGIAMLIFATYVGREQISPAAYPAFLSGAKAAFVIFTVLCFFGMLASLVRGKIRKEVCEEHSVHRTTR